MSPPYACPCCGYRTLHEGPGAYDLCPVCFWKDDGFQDDNAASIDGPNGITLAEGQRRYARYGSSSLHCLDKVRPPRSDEARDPAWRPLDLSGIDERQFFLDDFGQLLEAAVARARTHARSTRSDADIARFEGLRSALVLYVEQVDGFGVPRLDAGVDPQLDLDRDLLLDPLPGFFAG